MGEFEKKSEKSSPGFRVSNTIRGIKWGLINKILFMIIPFITRTLLIYKIGIEYAGINGLFSSILGILSVADLGFSGAVAFELYKPLSDDNEIEICAYLNYLKKIFLIVGIIIAVCGLVVVPFLPALIKGSYPADINIYVIYLILLFNTAIGYFMYAYKRTLLNASMRIDVVNKVGIYSQLALNIVQIVVICSFRNFYLYVVAIPVFTVLENLMIEYQCRKLYPRYKATGLLLANQKNSMFKRIKGLIMQRIGGIVLNSVDAIVISMFLGLTILGIYQNYYFIFTSINSFAAMIITALTPAVGNSLVSEDRKKNLADFEMFNFIYNWLASWAAICVLCLTQSFMEIWMGSGLMLSSLFVLMLAIYLYIYKWFDMTFVYMEAGGLWWKVRFVPIVAAGLNLFLNITLVQIIGIYGVLLSTIISILLIYDLGYALIVIRELFVGTNALRRFFINQSKYLACTVMAAALTWLVCSFLPLSGIAFLLAGFLICLVLPNLILLFLYHRSNQFKASIVFLNSFLFRKQK